MKERNIVRCPGPGLDSQSLDWSCDGAACKAGGDWKSCKTQIEKRGYKMIFTQDAKARARQTGDNIVDSEGRTYGR